MSWKWFRERASLSRFLGAALGAAIATALRNEIDEAVPMITEAWRFVVGGLGALALLMAFAWFQKTRELARREGLDDAAAGLEKARARLTVRAQAETELGISNATDVQLKGHPIALVGKVLDVGDYSAQIKTRSGEEIAVRHRPEDTDYLRTLRRGDVVKVEGTIVYIIHDSSDHVMIEGAISPPGGKGV